MELYLIEYGSEDLKKQNYVIADRNQDILSWLSKPGCNNSKDIKISFLADLKGTGSSQLLDLRGTSTGD